MGNGNAIALIIGAAFLAAYHFAINRSRSLASGQAKRQLEGDALAADLRKYRRVRTW